MTYIGQMTIDIYAPISTVLYTHFVATLAGTPGIPWVNVYDIACQCPKNEGCGC